MKIYVITLTFLLVLAPLAIAQPLEPSFSFALSSQSREFLTPLYISSLTAPVGNILSFKSYIMAEIVQAVDSKGSIQLIRLGAFLSLPYDVYIIKARTFASLHGYYLRERGHTRHNKVGLNSLIGLQLSRSVGGVTLRSEIVYSVVRRNVWAGIGLVF